MKKYNHRVILISDMHCTTQYSATELKEMHPNAKASVASGDTLGHSQDEKIACIQKDIQDFIEANEVDAMLVLGDLSIDDYSYRNLPENYCLKFKEACMDPLPFPSYAIPGNHDSYPDALWKEMFGYGRQFSVKVGDAAFILLDTFDNQPATSASGSAYVGIDMEFFKTELAKYPEGPIFLCSHYFKPGSYSEEFLDILKSNERIICLFDGHTHINALSSVSEDTKQPRVNIGGYGYHGEKREDGKWYFDRFDEKWAWGYEVLEWNQSEIHFYHIKPARRYVGFNGIFDFPHTIEHEIFIPFSPS